MQQIQQLVARPEFAETAASRALLADMALAAAVRAALKENESTREVNIDIQGHDGKLVLRGIVLNERNAAHRPGSPRRWPEQAAMSTTSCA